MALPLIRIAGARAALQERADVVVLGAGLAGLNASLLLEEQGYKVAIVEGRSRVGGRLYTMDDVPGHPEAGGSGVGSGYARLVDRCRQFNVDFEGHRPRTESSSTNTAIHLQGQTIKLSDWAGSALNPFAGDTRRLPPWLVGPTALSAYNPLPDAASWRDPAFANHDRSVAAVLEEKGWTAEQLRVAYGTNTSYGNSAHDLSAMMWWHIGRNAEIMAGDGKVYASVGGNQRMPEAMGRGVKATIHFDSQVVGIRSDNDGIEAVCADGSIFRGKAIVCTLPASALRLVRIDPGLPPAPQAAIDNLTYNRVFQIHFVPTRRFWESDGLPPSLWTDTLAGRFMALHYGQNPSDVTTFLAFANGFAADHLDRMEPKAAVAAVLAEVERIRPSAKGALRPVKTWSWQRDPFAGGAYACWQPGQIARYANAFDEPVGRLFFAGEHTAAIARGMEGAMESGERAALQIFERI
ncbi:flavin monoamine oxidase family protein [Sphingomonas sp. C3-2]|uniref:flavin monoamine oxidase family protein n=1 Tax=Sphingomonas sp. C3-2 TaxID=3062169 RepID=UPI00294B2A91|nr:FAD-dependent oxidoreductase [Sphingomonas sp. C3-2]WOK35473.1 FAD-dependent oxidoreductase [Sphingomonas sp. C3-2]